MPIIMKKYSCLWICSALMLVLGISSCNDSNEDVKGIETIIPSTLLQKAFYMAKDDTQQPVWLQEKIANNPYLNVYFSDKNGGHYILEYPNRTHTTCELYDTNGNLQSPTTQQALDATLSAGIPWTCTHIYSYPIKAGTEEWKSLTSKERVGKLQLSDNLLGIMRTEDLIKVCLDFPYATDFYAFDDYQSGFKYIYNEFNGLQELMSRNDLAEPFLLFLDVNWQKTEMMKSQEDLVRGEYTLLSMIFKIMLAQDAVINQMCREQIHQMLDLCIRNNNIETTQSDFWGAWHSEGTWYIYTKVIKNKGGFLFKDDREIRMFNDYTEKPIPYLYKEGDEYYYLFTDDFKARVLEYVKTFR